ncbi:hypothetical protein COW68_00140 [Candidatus Gracilibacteria bacterium CG18_big_fil_WC_8_21_14_2_50_38_16]|nr:MAG: hypothetical protein COW68_00140 [Candidatus Gracilibacteria bacterium CG18_big_fil_WC_8_21_14_2_50_38_16]
MNKIILASSLFLLISCGATTTTINSTSFKGSGFTIDIPSTWIAVEKPALPVPAQGSIALAVTSTDIVSGYANNMSILKGGLTEAITSKDYSITNYVHTTAAYLDFVKLDEKVIRFTEDNDTSNLYIFEAKYNTNTPKQKFIQTSKVCDNNVYLITFGLGLTTASTTKYEDLIKTFTCSQ